MGVVTSRTMRVARRPLVVLASTALMMIALLVPLSGVALANHGARTLDLTPELADNGVGATHTVTATLSATPDVGSPIEIDFEIAGPGDVDAGDTNLTPDRTCTVTNPAVFCTVSYSSAVVGVDTIRGWIDHDKDNTTVEADATEGQDETTTPGAETESDDTDVVTKTWFTGLPAGARLDCDDESGGDTERNPITGTGTAEIYTCTVVNTAASNAPVAGVKIDVENLDGANDPDNSAVAGTADMNDACTTAADGTCTVTISPVDSQIGTAIICFWADTDSDAVFDPAGSATDGGQCAELFNDPENDNLTDVVRKIWEARAVDSIDVTPDFDVNQTGTSHTATATVYDQFGDPVAGVNVDFVITGRNAVTRLDIITDANGVATATYPDTGAVGVAGNDTVTACTDQNNEDDDCGGALDAQEVEDSAPSGGSRRPRPRPTSRSTWWAATPTWRTSRTPPARTAGTTPPRTTWATPRRSAPRPKTAGGEHPMGHTITFTTSGVGMFVDADGNDLGRDG